MKKSLILFFLLLLIKQASNSGEPVNKIIVHPAVGEIITADEKDRYQLFPEYKTSAFGSAYISRSGDSTCFLVIQPVNGAGFQRPVSDQELSLMHEKIDRIAAEESRRQDEAKKERNRDTAEAITRFGLQLFIVALEIFLLASN